MNEKLGSKVGDHRDHETTHRADADTANDPLLPALPADLRAVRIGTCLNSRTRTLLAAAVSFDPEKLHGAKLLRFVGGSAKLECHANASSTAFAEESFFSTAGQFQKGFSWGVKATAGFNMSTANKSGSSSFDLNCYVSYVFKDQEIWLLQARPETYFQCMMEDFQERYNRIMEAKTTDDYLRAHADFTRFYGDGCVTKLFLASGSAARISINVHAGEEAHNRQYSASLAVNSPVGGGSVATSWGNSVAAMNREAKMSVHSQSIPQNSPTMAWVQGIVQQYSGKGIEMLTESANAPNPPTGVTVEPPKISPLHPGDKKPKKPALEDTSAVTENLIDQMKREDGFEGTLEEYRAEQKRRIDALSARSVVDETNSLLRAVGLEEVSLDPPVPAGPASSEREMRATDDPWDLGGYVPIGYEVTPWVELFPDLRLDLPPTMGRIRLGKLWTYFLTRVEFSEYLYFLADVGQDITGNPFVGQDAIRYAAWCTEFATAYLNGPGMGEDIGFTQERFNQSIRQFEEAVRKLPDFRSFPVYEYFFKNYDLFGGSPLGYVHTKNSGSGPEYKIGGKLEDWRPIPAAPPVNRTHLIQDALRFYLIIRPDGSLVKTTFCNASWQGVSIENVEKNESDWWADYNFRHEQKNIIQGLSIDYSHVLEGKSVRGAPMFGELPIGLVKGGLTFPS